MVQVNPKQIKQPTSQQHYYEGAFLAATELSLLSNLLFFKTRRLQNVFSFALFCPLRSINVYDLRRRRTLRDSTYAPELFEFKRNGDVYISVRK